MTESSAEIDPRIGGRHSSGDGYIWGENLELEPGVRIVQSWRTTDFDDSDPDSRLELTFEETDEGSLLTLRHTNIPSGQGESYHKGWEEYYFDPMEEYFDGME
jgi:activator of HSP90 ATPase